MHMHPPLGECVCVFACRHPVDGFPAWMRACLHLKFRWKNNYEFALVRILQVMGDQEFSDSPEPQWLV